ncbi:MFS gliotoxin efflux transporter GliA [Curvularia clavata]|uniref:MFS gliotoxin efflux transporter GliA n=1 Tax=Curvularia clavata TaxID=95742 RepID=A0A9Q9DQK7_CURCL|nr:MFS gliotoxin efflux transporter GliA [Curvularia clavata]
MTDSLDFESNNKADMDTPKPAASSHDEHDIAESVSEKQDGTTAPSTDQVEPEYLNGLRLGLVMFTIFVSTILVSLEIGIIATAISGITNDLRKLDDVGWYGGATFILAAAASPLWGKLYKYLDVKWVYLSAVGIFLAGSIVAAAAPNSVAVVVGRALQGWGASGVLGGTLIVINYVAPLRNHLLLMGTWMAVFMVSTILGPVIGGAFTSGMNLPVGGPIVVLLLLFLRIPKHIKPVPAAWKEVILNLDIPGFCLLLAPLVCLTLALQRDGQTKAWDDGSVIATLVLWILLTIGFFVVEWLQVARAMALMSILKQRTTWSNVIFCFVSYAALYQVMFYLPIYFQSIYGQSAIISGVNTLPFLAFFALGAMVSGGAIGKTGYTQPHELAGTLIMTAGMGLIYILDVNSPKSKYIGAQIPFGFGIGLCNQVPMTAVQGFSKPDEVASATGIMWCLLCLHRAIPFRMLHALRFGSNHLDVALVLGTGASELQDVFRGDDLTSIIAAYMVGIKDVFTFSLAYAAFSVISTALIPLKRLPDHKKKPTEEVKASEEVQEDKEVII